MPEPDLKLFIDRAAWFASEHTMTVHQFLDWFTGYLEVGDRRFIVDALPFFQEDHLRAERILCSLLETDFRRKHKVRGVSSRITRNTDWPRTYAKAFPLVPQRYYQVEARLVLDDNLLGVLAALAQSWTNIIRKLEEMFSDDSGTTALNRDLAGRAKRLEQAVQCVTQRGVRPHSRPLSSQYRQTIMRALKPADAKCFLNILDYWNSYDLKKTASHLAIMVGRLTNKAQNSSLASLFEMTTNLCILHAAMKEGWLLHRVKIRSRNSTKSIFTFHLKKKQGRWNCVLGKGNPRIVFPDSTFAKTESESDRMLGLRKQAGFGGSGFEPDIVMGFYPDGQENNPVVLFGDAKRYAKSDIARAYKETVASTMVAFGHWAGLEITGNATWHSAFCCPVNPFFTLFYLNNTVQSSTRPSGRRMDGRPPGHSRPFPPVVAISLEYMQGEDNQELRAWFREIVQQIENHDC
ncbi:hypothetical protein ACLG6S_07280 [Thermodesulfobacteriota bacterium B35]